MADPADPPPERATGNKVMSSAESSTGPMSPMSPEHTGCLATLNRAINGTIERAFYKLGRLVGRWPRVVLIVALLAALAIASGVRLLENETRGDKLWLPEGTQSQRDDAVVDALYPAFGRFQQFYLTREDEGSVLTPAAFDAALAVHEATQRVTWENSEDGERVVPWRPAVVDYTDVCLNRNGDRGAASPSACVASNVLAIFSYDPAAWRTETAILATLNDPASWNRSVVGPGFVADSALGGIERVSGQIASARALAANYFLAGNLTLSEAQEEDEAADGWEGEWLEMLEEQDEATEEFQITRLAGRSFDDEFGSTIDNDVLLLQAAILGIAIYTVLAISNCRDGCVGSRVLLTFGGLINISLAVAASYGFGAYVGLIFSPLMTILPFIMIGIGVDGMFVLQSALDLTDPADPMEERMGFTLAHAGVSVTVASLTNFAAFIIGSNTSLPALRAFSIYAAMGLLFDLLLQITFFAAIMCIDKRRQEARRFDVALCFKDKGPVDAGICCGACGAGRPHEKLSTKAMRYLGALLSKRPAQIVVVILWLGALAAGIVGTSQMRVNADVNDFIPDGSYLKDYFKVNDDYFVTEGASAALYFRSTPDVPIDFSDPAIQRQMEEAEQRLIDNEYSLDSSFDSWWSAFRDDLGGVVSQGTFYTDLQAFLASPAGLRYASDVVFAEPANPAAGIESHRFQFNWRELDETLDEVDALKSTRATVDDIPPPLGTHAFVYGAAFQQIEQYATIGGEAFLNIGLAFAMIALIIFFLLANPLASIITFLCVASAILELIGFMNFNGTDIDSVTVIFLVISLGLAVDYSVHVAHGFLATRESNMQLRLQRTLMETGAPVINGAMSTLIAAFFLAGSGSYVFITFFFALLIVVLAGAFQGLIVLPVLMAIFKPAPHVEVRPVKQAGVPDETVAAPPAPAVEP